MVDSGAGVSACPFDYAPECEVNRGSVKLPLVGAGGDRIEHIGQKTVGYATRDGANFEIAFEAAKVRRPVLSVDSLVEKGQVAVFTDSGGFIITRSALQVDPAVRKVKEHRSYMAHALNFTAWCMGSDETQNGTAEAFGCKNQDRGKVLLDCRATDTVGSVEAIID